jgi:hypothetical protein
MQERAPHPVPSFDPSDSRNEGAEAKTYRHRRAEEAFPEKAPKLGNSTTLMSGISVWEGYIGRRVETSQGMGPCATCDKESYSDSLVIGRLFGTAVQVIWTLVRKGRSRREISTEAIVLTESTRCPHCTRARWRG